MRQHEAVVQFGAPAGEAARRKRVLPEAGDEGPDKQVLDEAHPRMRRHFKGPEFQESQAAGGVVGRIELVDAELGAVGVARDVDQDVPEDTIDQPGRACARRVQLHEGDLEFV